jgi:glucose/arabinose dehydrogenase
MMQRGFIYFLQLALLLAALLVARELTEWLWLVPEQLRKQSPIEADAFLTIAAYFLIAHALLLAAVQFVNRAPPFSSFRRFTIEVYAALVATSLACSGVFLFTVVPFSANYFAWVYVVLMAGYLILFGGYQWLSSGPTAAAPSRSLLRLVFSPWTVLTVVLVFSPGVLAALYKVNRDFSNVVNGLRASLNHSVSSTWALVPAYPGHVFEQPMYLAFDPERAETIMVLSRPGRLFRYVTAPDWQEEILLDLSAEVGSVDSELGAYSFALHPEFNQPQSANAGFVYVYYTHISEDGQFNRLARFDLSLPTREEREGSRVLLMDLGRAPSGMHNGGGMFFGPDGFLYLSIGDCSMEYDTQQIDERLLSGIFRIDVDMQGGEVSAPIKRQPQDGVTQNYYIPVDNPWFGEDGALEEYWALGFRNPWRMSMDPATGSIWLGDVGRDRFEEHNRVEKGDNGQWNYQEGPVASDTERRGPIIGREIQPIYHYKQTALARASTGGLVYRGAKHAALQGRYVFADNQAGTLHALDPEEPMSTSGIIAQGGQFGQLGITSVEHDAGGDIYVTLLGSKERPTGEILRLVPAEDDLADGVTEIAATDDVETKYVSVCSRCHGKDGRGAPEMDLGQERPDFTSSEWQDRVTDDYLRRVIVEGGDAVGISEQMPAWEDFFNEAEMTTLIRKLRAFEE